MNSKEGRKKTRGIWAREIKVEIDICVRSRKKYYEIEGNTV